MQINKPFIVIILSWVVLCSCNSDFKTNDREFEQEKSRLESPPQTNLNKEDTTVNLVPCSNVIKQLENVSGVSSYKVLVRDWTQGNVFLSPYTKSSWDRDNFTVSTVNYKYRDSVLFYVHMYKYKFENRELDIRKLIKNLNGKKLYKIIIGNLAERTFMYFIEETDEYDILVIDVPAYYNREYELRNKLIKKLYKKFDCTYLLCDDQTNPCEFRNLADDEN